MGMGMTRHFFSESESGLMNTQGAKAHSLVEKWDWILTGVGLVAGLDPQDEDQKYCFLGSQNRR